VEGAFRRPLPPGLRLIETFGRDADGAFVRLEAHLARLAATAARLGVPFDRPAIDAALAAVSGDGALRVRLTLDAAGTPEVTAAPRGPAPTLWRVAIADARLDPDDPWLRVKTSERALYDAARAALPAGVDELVFLNRRGEVCEGAITTVFLRVGDALLTPPLGCGLLPGVLRGDLLRRGAAREAVLRPRDLDRGALFVGNSLRGLIRARRV
jgi:4-amino-4-deoxychorismate lyase